MSNDKSQNNKRIAKNTMLLYFRTFITMIVGLYTGRVMLQALGVDNYGINSVVGGIVSMSSLITVSVSVAISRYITYSLGQGDKERLKIMYSTAINAQIIMAIIAAIALEVAGLWFLNTTANIPDGRMEAAEWVLHCSIVSLMLSLISSPRNALIIAHEKMGIYAYMSIVDVVLKLAICFAIMAYDGDRLILLSLLSVMVSLGMFVFYGIYCKRNFEEAHYSHRIFDKALTKEITIFSGWNMINNSAWIFATQGINMLVNVFFGVVYNASRSIAVTVNSAIQGFVGNFTMAFQPQMTKSYAAGDIEYAMHLAIRGTKFSWLMMYVFIVPVCVEADTLLKIWLGEVPEQAALFLRFAMFESLFVTLGNSLFKLAQADGRIKRFNIHIAIGTGLVFPIAWVAFRLGAPAWSAYLLFIVVFIVLNIVRVFDIKRLMPFPANQYMKECIIPCTIVSIISFVVPLTVAMLMEQGIIRFFINVLISIIWTLLCELLLGLSKNERNFFYEKTKNAWKRIF